MSGRPREPSASIDDRPEYVLERGPHGTYTRRKVGFLDVAEAEKRMQPYSPAFSILGKLDDALNPDRTATWGGSNLGMVHEDWRARGGYSFGVKHSHLDGMDGSKSECNNMYDTTLAYEALNNPFPVPVSIGIPLKDLISEDVLLFPGPGSYTLKPTVNAICAGGYMQRHGSKGPIAVPRVRPGEAELEVGLNLFLDPNTTAIDTY